MNNQNHITNSQSLLKDDGTLSNEGWAKSLLLKYDRNKIKASWLRIKEWDYYYIIDHENNLCLTCTLSDLGYAGLMAIAWLDFNTKKVQQMDSIAILPRGKLGLSPDSSIGHVLYKDKKLTIDYEYTLPERKIKINAPEFMWGDEKGLEADITLYQDPKLESMVIATSWKENRKAFYYNQKINCMPAQGRVKIGDKIIDFSPKSSLGGLDWGRGRWTYKNRWYWGSASGYLNDKTFGWNIGYGFSDRSPASENMLFYDNKAHKIDQVTFHIDTENYLNPWKFTSNDDRFEMDFQPLIDRNSKINLGIIKSFQHQVFGLFTGYVKLDDGTKITVKNFLGFAEDVFNQW